MKKSIEESLGIEVEEESLLPERLRKAYENLSYHFQEDSAEYLLPHNQTFEFLEHPDGIGTDIREIEVPREFPPDNELCD